MVGPPESAKALVPLTEQTREKAEAGAVTGSENVTVTFAPAVTVLLPSAGEVDTTVGAVSGVGTVSTVCEPRPSKVSVA